MSSIDASSDAASTSNPSPSASGHPAPSNPETPGEDGGNLSTTMEPGSIQAEELAKVRVRRTRVSTASKESESIELPEDLDIFWLPEDSQPTSGLDTTAVPELPPPEILQEALNNLLITLHPQIQHRATYPFNEDVPVEPTLGLYCPIEGGDYIVDATVKELARRINAEVVVLDAVQLAAGEWGQFGKAANSLQLPFNPLKVPALAHQSSLSRHEATEADFDDEDAPQPFGQGMMTLTLLAPQLSQGRSLMPSSSRRSTAPSKIKVFFDSLVNASPPAAQGSPSQPNRPRIIYIRDFTTLAPTSSAWYAPLLSAVRQRRRGPLSRPSSAISSPITIVFGMSPPLSAPASAGSSGSNVLSFLMNENTPGATHSQESKPERVDWSETEQAERSRERRLQDRLKKWERHEGSLLNEIPRLSTSLEDDAMEGVKPEVIVIGPNGKGPIPPMLAPGMGGVARGPEADKKSSFFRTSILVPSKRSRSHERSDRIARRREINELSMRMAVGAVGGNVELSPAAQHFAKEKSSSTQEPPEAAADHHASTSAQPVDKPTEPQTTGPDIWEEWGNRIEVWPNVKKIADNAVGRVLSGAGSSVPSLDATVVPWEVVQTAWKAHSSSRDTRKVWLKDFGLHPVKDLEDAPIASQPVALVDEIVERVRSEADLDAYEQRLLGCIVDAASMPTSFNQVHLPPNVIDSVRTIVSLPLLHPHAFQQGILKQHGMTGCLLFGPPGTGKTLVVRALAREAGCRMLVITPSDIMDMYVGEAEKLVRATFSLARRLSPCVIFLDELDALFGARMAAREAGGASAAHRGVITEFMQEMDGLKTSREDGIIVIGATNRPFDLDDAILRRLPRRLLIDLPGPKEREEILKILLRDENLAPDVALKVLAEKTESYSGSDLKHLCVSAALDAVKEYVQVPWRTNPQVGATPTLEVVQEPVAEDKVVESKETEAVSEEATPRVECKDETTGVVTEEVAVVEAVTPPATEDAPTSPVHVRTLHLRNFLKALKEITPSSSESLGSLADLRKWNEEFGEGRTDRRRKQVWGKGRFGFIDERAVQKVEEGKVSPSPP